jgi:hypothetical protein
MEVLSLAGEYHSTMRLYYSPTATTGNGSQTGAWVFMRAMSDSGGSEWPNVRSNTKPLAGKWTHLVATWDQATGEMSLYVNGAKQTAGGRRFYPSSTAWATTRGLQVGRSMVDDVWAKSPSWAVDDVQAYNRLLTPAEVAAIVAQTRNQVASYQFQDATALGKDTPTGSGSTRTALRTLASYGQAAQVDGFGVFESTKALQLDGSGDYLAPADGKPVVDTGDSWSVSVWTTLTSRPTSFQPLVAQCGLLECGFALGYFGQDDTWRLMLPQGDSAGAPTVHMVSSAEPPELGQRVLLTATYDAFNRVARIYVDGETQAYGGGSVCDTLDCADPDDGLGTPWTAGGAFNIGKWIHNSDTSYWSGLIDDVYVYQGLLVDRDVNDLAFSNVAP